MRFGILSLALALAGLGAGRVGLMEGQSAVPPESVQEQPVAYIQTYQSGLAAVHAANRRVELSLARDQSVPDEAVLIVDYPVPTDDPAGRDVRCDAESRDWSGGRAIAFQIKPSQALRFSVSFLDRNNVAYTTWVELKGNVWQRVRIAFDDLRPSPYFQPPDAKRGSPLDVSDVKFIAFAPQDKTSGRLAIGRLVVVK